MKRFPPLVQLTTRFAHVPLLTFVIDEQVVEMDVLEADTTLFVIRHQVAEVVEVSHASSPPAAARRESTHYKVSTRNE